MKNDRKYLGDPHKAKRKWEKKKLIAKNQNLSTGKNFNNAADFWDAEYKEDNGKNFSLSTEPSEDLQKFVRWLEREYKGQEPINRYTKFVDVGCGNGRNSFYLAENFGAQGIGYDISPEAIRVANAKLKKPEGSPRGKLQFIVQNVNKPIPVENNSQDLVIDAIVTHVLKKEEREFFKSEVLRVLIPGSYYFLKSLLLDEDIHSKRMIKEDAGRAGEENSYIHPTMGIFEHVPSEAELEKFYEEDFYIDKIERSFAHKINGRANKRRYIVMYLRKK